MRAKSMKSAIMIAGISAAAGATSSLARAQTDVNPPLPNVLLLIDTSGSMEYLVKFSATGAPILPGDVSVPNSGCTPGIPNPQQVKNRWVQLAEALTGTINNFSCEAMKRDTAFATEYKFMGVDPYDKGYYLPYHRPLSNGCAIGPGTLDPAWSPAWKWFDWPATPFYQHDYTATNKACTSPFAQSNDGLLDTFRDRIRFSLMTFDTLAHAGTGLQGAVQSGTSDATSGNKGMWSYYRDWMNAAPPKQGKPTGCTVASDWEVGARNQAAPPWEGRLVPFPPYAATQLQVTTTNDRIQQEILAVRPYGATPIAGMLDDALEYLTNDASLDPSVPVNQPAVPYGPKDDPYWKNGCRKMYVLLLSDGEPNMDLRPNCTGNDCPYPTADTTAATLFNTWKIPTYVVGFAIPTGGPLTSCSQVDPIVDCGSPTQYVKNCCELHKIAVAGGTTKAFFADATSTTTIADQISVILSQIAASSTSRTVPITYTVVPNKAAQGNAPAVQYTFVANFKVPSTGQPWYGQIPRERFVCKTAGQPPDSELDSSKGDLFDQNVDSNDAVNKRKFFTVIADQDAGGNIISSRTFRPNIGAAVDGLGTHAGTVTNALDGITFASFMSSYPGALSIANGVPACSAAFNTASAATCTDMLVKWETGEINGGNLPTRDKACATGTCSELGAAYHATPAIIGPPREALSDDSYLAFAQQRAKRPLMLYTATADGQLHAFKVASNDPAETQKVDTLSNNELWSFLPPAVLPHILPTYNKQSILLDGTPVVADVALERKQGTIPTWSTVLVGSGGRSAAGGFYYALDVTDPYNPKFLWQISASDTGAPLFGKSGGTPAIATVVLNDGQGAKEVAVAVLPGGGASPTGQVNCAHGTACQPLSGAQVTCDPIMQSAVGFAPRANVRCWDPTQSAARTLTIVNLKTGEVIMSFRAAAGDGPALLNSNTMTVPFASPITGVPIPYPGRTGQVSNRVFVGDADGVLWRVDLSATDPTLWQVRLAWDAYSLPGDSASAAEPIETPPLVSVDATGNTVVLFSTGDQESFTASSAVTRVWSITESPSTGNLNNFPFKTKENWYLPFSNGKRVTGPMALLNGVLYFSTFDPSITGNACQDGKAAVWGVDYLRADTASCATDPASPMSCPTTALVPLKQLVPDATTPLVKKHFIEAIDFNTIIFGVSLAQKPSCLDTATVPDPYFGSVTYLSNVTSADTQVIFNAGAGKGLSAASVVNDKGITGVQRYSPPPFAQLGRIDSWASIVE